MSINNSKQNPWQFKDKKNIYENPWIKVEEHDVIMPNGKEGIYGKVLFKNRAIAILPIDSQGNTWLVGQYRYTIDEYSWEIPMGGGPLNEDILESAKRELKEETGLKAQKWTNIGKFHTSNSCTDEEGFIFLAEDLSQHETEFDETEVIEIMKVPFEKALDMVMNEKITDVISCMAILKASKLLF
ncbi:NUDIX hydrolase [Aureibacter tunicatorum]|uniref:GDP-mannose pyrophosphatase n=1 Tax=Aureibacter tunicatorum TaxID=866807 RepID=A0AAE4BUB4_9BACT|nr:NUDIX hydrolase [Aureibacter tunicatorum]MDR6240880.1 8-oxo-dGTP pyrophosphatase MutT (NUDIX family) [Aureibacter tunicatorum]BDD03660.1 hypothetical protein AUTU_11430 [Aureibacter tunicatorum]